MSMNGDSAGHGQKRQPARPVPPPVIDSQTLFGCANEIRLRHRGQEYRLRITRQDKLILTK